MFCDIVDCIVCQVLGMCEIGRRYQRWSVALELSLHIRDDLVENGEI